MSDCGTCDCQSTAKVDDFSSHAGGAGGMEFGPAHVWPNIDHEIIGAYVVLLPLFCLVLLARRIGRAIARRYGFGVNNESKGRSLLHLA